MSEQLPRYRLGQGEVGPVVVRSDLGEWQGQRAWVVVEPGVWQGARWDAGTLIWAKEEVTCEA